ncbi:MAG TPA: carbohydrate kinase family protein [Candidatus Saccharimonadales bacterium]|nr:carbohydrate kinase family protein [Candidatus Saccharimonadales bacterium]
MPRIYDVITIGEATIDAFMTLHDSSDKVQFDQKSGKLEFKHGEKINVEKYDFLLGGNAANVAVGLTRLGLNATLACEIGDDEFSIKIRNHLAQEKVERVLVTQSKGRQSNFSVIINFKGDRTIFNEDLKREHKFDYADVAAKYIYLTSMGEDWVRSYEDAVEFVKKHGGKIAFNPGTHQLHNHTTLIHQVMKDTEIIFVNKEEAELILFNHYSKRVDDSDHYIKNLCQELQDLGPKIVVVTNGKEGSHVLDAEGNFQNQDLYPGKCIERTGAGDSFATGFLGAVLYGMDLATAMKWGAVNSASVVGVVGAEPGLLMKEEIEKRV